MSTIVTNTAAELSGETLIIATDPRITQLTGDVLAGPATGSTVATLANTGVTAGAYGDASHVAQITIDAAGRITDAVEVSVSAVVAVTVNDGLEGDGSIGDPLNVKVDGTSIGFNGSNELTSLSSGGGGLVLLGVLDASNSATLEFISFITSTYDDYMIEAINVRPITTAVHLYMNMSSDNGSSWDTSGIYAWGSTRWNQSGTGDDGATTDTGFRLDFLSGDTLSNNVNAPLCGTFYFRNPNSAASYKGFQGQCTYWSSATSNFGMSVGGGLYKSASAVNALQFSFSAGNIDSGSIRLYGIEK